MLGQENILQVIAQASWYLIASEDGHTRRLHEELIVPVGSVSLSGRQVLPNGQDQLAHPVHSHLGCVLEYSSYETGLSVVASNTTFRGVYRCS